LCRCIDDISIKESSLTITTGINPSLATFLSPKIGYLKAAEIAEEAMKKNPLIDIAVKRRILSADEADNLLI
jgi:aspartate ammonia-lyase